MEYVSLVPPQHETLCHMPRMFGTHHMSAKHYTSHLLEWPLALVRTLLHNRRLGSRLDLLFLRNDPVTVRLRPEAKHIGQPLPAETASSSCLIWILPRRRARVPLTRENQEQSIQLLQAEIWNSLHVGYGSERDLASGPSLPQTIVEVGCADAVCVQLRYR